MSSRASLLAAVCPVVLGIASLFASLSPLAAQSDSSEMVYRLGPKDLVRVNVVEAPELNVDRRISDSGKLVLPSIGEVAAAGLTDVELARRLEQLMESRGVQRATVSIEVLEYRSRPISLIGAVAKPGSLAVAGRWTLLEALAAAGGLTADHGAEIHVLRRAENGLTDQLTLRVDDLFVRGLPEVNIPIFANDLVNVPPRTDVPIYCLGQVRSPGAVVFKSTERITLLSVLARAGGITERASKKIRIRRRVSDTESREIVVDYGRLLAGKEIDPEIREGDLIVVKESFF